MRLYITLDEPYFSYAKNHSEIFSNWDNNSNNTFFLEIMNYENYNYTNVLPIILPYIYTFHRYRSREIPDVAKKVIGEFGFDDEKIMQIVI